jgi:hypothetical protein
MAWHGMALAGDRIDQTPSQIRYKNIIIITLAGIDRWKFLAMID